MTGLKKCFLVTAMIGGLTFFSCSDNTDLAPDFSKCFAFLKARANLKIEKDTTLFFTIESMSSIGERKAEFSLDSKTIGKENLNFEIPKDYVFPKGTTSGQIPVTLKYIDSDSLVRIILNVNTATNCVGYQEDSVKSNVYRSVRIDFRSVQPTVSR